MYWQWTLNVPSEKTQEANEETSQHPSRQLLASPLQLSRAAMATEAAVHALCYLLWTTSLRGQEVCLSVCGRVHAEVPYAPVLTPLLSVHQPLNVAIVNLSSTLPVQHPNSGSHSFYNFKVTLIPHPKSCTLYPTHDLNLLVCQWLALLAHYRYCQRSPSSWPNQGQLHLSQLTTSEQSED